MKRILSKILFSRLAGIPAVCLGMVLCGALSASAQGMTQDRMKEGFNFFQGSERPFRGVLAHEVHFGPNPIVEMSRVSYGGKRKFHIRILNPADRAGDQMIIGDDGMWIYSEQKKIATEIKLGEARERKEQGPGREFGSRGQEIRRLLEQMPLLKMSMIMRHFDKELVGAEKEPGTGIQARKYLAHPPPRARGRMMDIPGPEGEINNPPPPGPGAPSGPPPGPPPGVMDLQVFIWIDVKNNIPLRVEMIDPMDGKIIEAIYFAEIEFDPKFPKDEFAFKPPAGVKVIDDWREFQALMFPSPTDPMAQVPKNLPKGFVFIGANPVQMGQMHLVQLKFEYRSDKGRVMPVSVFSMPMPPEAGKIKELIQAKIKARARELGVNWAKAEKGPIFLFTIGEPDTKLLEKLLKAF